MIKISVTNEVGIVRLSINLTSDYPLYKFRSFSNNIYGNGVAYNP